MGTLHQFQLYKGPWTCMANTLLPEPPPWCPVLYSFSLDWSYNFLGQTNMEKEVLSKLKDGLEDTLGEYLPLSLS